jgi:hypothetical protein
VMSWVTAPRILNLDTRWKLVVSFTLRPFYLLWTSHRCLLGRDAAVTINQPVASSLNRLSYIGSPSLMTSMKFMTSRSVNIELFDWCDQNVREWRPCFPHNLSLINYCVTCMIPPNNSLCLVRLTTADIRYFYRWRTDGILYHTRC